MPSLENSPLPNSVDLPSLVSVKCLFIDIGNSKLKSSDSPAEITANLLRAEKSTFNSLGLSLLPKTYSSFPNQSPFTVILENRNNFVQFLKSIEPQDVPRFNLLLGFKKIADDFSQQISSQTDFNNKGLSDEIIQLLAATPEISQQYQRLGFDPKSSKLSTYAKFIEKRCIKDFISLEQSGLISETNSPENPSNWVKITSDEIFEEKWGAATSVLRYFHRTLVNQSIYEILRQHLHQGLNLSLTKLNSQNYLNKKRIEYLKSISAKYFDDHEPHQ